MAIVKEVEKLDDAIGFIFSLSGFTKEAERYCKKNHIAFSSDPQWVDLVDSETKEKK